MKLLRLCYVNNKARAAPESKENTMNTEDRPTDRFGVCFSNPLPGVPGRGSCSSAVPKASWPRTAFRTAFLGFTLVTLSAAGLAAQTDGARGTTPPDRVFPEEPLRRGSSS